MNEEKLFVPVEECLAIKELGFIRPCFAGWYFHSYFEKYRMEFPSNPGKMYKTQRHTILAPTYEQVFDWFDEVFGYNSVILKDTNGYYHYNHNTPADFTFSLENAAFNGPFKDKLEAKLGCVKQLIILVHKTNI